MSKVLVVDDEEFIRELAEKILTRAGHDVLLAADGQSGVSKLLDKNNNIDVILLDIRMKGLSGFETLKEIRAQLRDIPCILSSGNLFDKDEIPVELNHNVYFLPKPYRANQLSDLVDEILKVT